MGHKRAHKKHTHVVIKKYITLTFKGHETTIVHITHLQFCLYEVNRIAFSTTSKITSRIWGYIDYTVVVPQASVKHMGYNSPLSNALYLLLRVILLDCTNSDLMLMNFSVLSINVNNI